MNKLEKQKFILTHRPSIKFSTLQEISATELDRLVAHIQAEVAQRDAAQALVELKLLRDGGLRNMPSNFSTIKRSLGPYFTVEQFRQAITLPAFKNSLQWDAQQPFAEAVREEQQTKQLEDKRRREFSAVVKANPKFNLSDCDANYFSCNQQIEVLLAAHALTESTYIQNLTEGLVAGYFSGLVQNGPEKTQDIDRQNREGLIQKLTAEGRLNQSAQYYPTVRRRILTESTFSELRERANLLAELADNHSHDKFLNSLHFADLFASVRSNSEYRSDVEQMRERRRLARMSPSEIRAENERIRAVDSTIERHESDTTPDGFKKLRPESKWNGEPIDKGLLWRVSKEDVVRLIKLYGKPQLDDRIRNGITPVAVQEN